MSVTQQQAREALDRMDDWAYYYKEGKSDFDALKAFIAQHPDTQAAQYEGGYPLRAEVWFRSSTNEWVLEISGAINGTDLISRHTEPATTSPEDVPGLPSLYKPDTQGEPVAGAVWHEDGVALVRRGSENEWCINRGGKRMYLRPSPDTGLRRALEGLRSDLITMSEREAPNEFRKGAQCAYEWTIDRIAEILAAHPETKHE